MADPLPDWVRAEAGVIGLRGGLPAASTSRATGGDPAGRDRLRVRRGVRAAADHGAPPRRRRRPTARCPRPRRSGGLLDAFDARLPFTLTAGQIEVSEEIMAELARPQPMQRLLQGEVGSGKTLVALRAMLAVVDAGGQAALLAPTEVLAAQHFQTDHPRCSATWPRAACSAPPSTRPASRCSPARCGGAPQREATLRAASGEAGIVIGTHALLSAGVQFADLGLVVVDEQHRFGVEQRAALSAKAAARPHVLVMTATPDPALGGHDRVRRPGDLDPARDSRPAGPR